MEALLAGLAAPLSGWRQGEQFDLATSPPLEGREHAGGVGTLPDPGGLTIG